MHQELQTLRNIGITLKLDQICLSSSLSLYKDSRKHFNIETCLYGCLIITTKLCENLRKTRDLVNVVLYEINGKACMDMDIYLQKKGFMLKAESLILEFYQYNVTRFRMLNRYSLLLTLCAAISMPKYAVKVVWSLLNESFLCEKIDIDEMDKGLPCVVIVGRNLIGKYSEGVLEKWKISEEWYEEFGFEKKYVNKMVLIMLEYLGENLEGQDDRVSRDFEVGEGHEDIKIE
ncbi:hypothetical protein SteCoe_27109 [Stentor coeruleus]|uniref:Cyclin N-terminal domain-containing protein n=1 Tax=Stentor coeruleus TaxID=5963 RepID=A0A1R2BBC9_9CILI|nr:hypothetical protein SteCoe_27109 [Stentor coeruleus]